MTTDKPAFSDQSDRDPTAAMQKNDGEPRDFAGLSSTEAQRRLAEYGLNLPVKRRRARRLLELLKLLGDPMAVMLAVAAFAYLAMGQRIEGLGLLIALVPVMGIDILLAARSQDALRKLARRVEAKARVVRDGHEVALSAELLVPGDVVILDEGDLVPADANVLRAANLTTDESQLSGESEPQPKHPGSGIFAGSKVLAGEGIARITATGASTRYGKIAHLVAGTSASATPLERKVATTVRWTASTGLALAALLFGSELLRGTALPQAFLAAIAFAMASVGEEFVLVLTLFLSVGASRLSRRGVLVRRLSCVETLGSTTVMCVDKTGTLTTGAFKLEALVPLKGDMTEVDLLRAAALACELHARDAIEAVIIERCTQSGIDLDRVYSDWRLVRDYDFDARGKHMSHVWDGGDRRGTLIVAKGALEGILEHCAISPEARARVTEANAALAARGMRILAVAGRLAASAADFNGCRAHDEAGLEMYGLLGFHDPVRPSAPAAVAECQRAGIKLKLITGDHPLTAHAIADATGLAHDDAGIVVGEELDNAAPNRLAQLVDHHSIFARVRPEQKYLVVDALVRSGAIVAMTGDGINDAPALTRAHIGISMGPRATEVARAAAGLVLLNDDFAALVATVREGRRLFTDIQKAFRYLIGFKTMLVAVALMPPVLDLPVILTPLNIVWLELIVHSVSVLIFDGRDSGRDVMRRLPRDPTKPIVTYREGLVSACCGLLSAGGAIGAFVFNQPEGTPYARSTAMILAVMASVFLVFAELAAPRRWWEMVLPRDLRFWCVCAAAAATPLLFTSVRPIADLFELTRVTPQWWAAASAFAAISVGWRTLWTAK